jgi:hypothetical protein
MNSHRPAGQSTFPICLQVTSDPTCNRRRKCDAAADFGKPGTGLCMNRLANGGDAPGEGFMSHSHADLAVISVHTDAGGYRSTETA